MSDENKTQFCTLAMLPGSEAKTRAALLTEAKWVVGEEIKVRFLGGDLTLKKRVQKVAEKWTTPDMANLAFHFVDSGPADIRVDFAQGKGSWSYLGTVCRKIPTSDPTMNFGWLTPASADAEISRVVLHEFGHALGLVHEHQNPNRPIKWNKPAVYAALGGPPNNWDKETVDHNIFDKYPLTALKTTAVDDKSIMMYAIPSSWTLDGFSAGLNSAVSQVDIDFIHKAYPY